jgi:hypothetical protein
MKKPHRSSRNQWGLLGWLGHGSVASGQRCGDLSREDS